MDFQHTPEIIPTDFLLQIKSVDFSFLHISTIEIIINKDWTNNFTITHKDVYSLL